MCAVLYRGTVSCDQRLGSAVRLLDIKGASALSPRSYFEALNNAIWLMSLKRRLNLDAKLANFIDTYTGLEASSRKGCVYAIDLDSTTYQRLPIGGAAHDQSRSGDEQDWRPVYLYNALVISVQLRMQMRPEDYTELVELDAGAAGDAAHQVHAADGAHEAAYDAAFRDAAAFVRGLNGRAAARARPPPAARD